MGTNWDSFLALYDAKVEKTHTKTTSQIKKNNYIKKGRRKVLLKSLINSKRRNKGNFTS